MYAAVRREQIKKFERCLTEGVWKIITTITLNPTSGQYRISDLKYKIGFVFKTIVSPCDSVSNALFLSLAKFDVILSGSANANILLWGKYAEIGDQACQQLTDGIVVCLIRFAKINLYNGNYIDMYYYIYVLFFKTCPFLYADNRSVSNSFDVSQVFVDSALDELGLFKQRWVNAKQFVLFWPLIQIGRGTIFVVVLTTRRLSKRKLSNFKMSRYLKSQDFGVTYAMVLQNLLLPSEFWLHLHIMEQTGEVRCMLFDSHAMDILGTSAPKLLDGSFDEIEDPTVLPDVINGLKGKTFQFLLCIQRQNIFGGYDSFIVARVYTGSLMLINGVDLSDVDLSSTSTPSSKRKDLDDVDGNDQASTSRKKCSKITMHEEGFGE
ncbi:putative nucleic acid-binding, replication factor A [Arabidopsis thaliana]